MLLLFSKILRNTIVNRKNNFFLLKSIKMKKLATIYDPYYGPCRHESVNHMIYTIYTPREYK